MAFLPEGLSGYLSPHLIMTRNRGNYNLWGKFPRFSGSGAENPVDSIHEFSSAVCGERWAPRLMPKVLKELMRHKRIETTMKYYVGTNAEATADVVWQVYDRMQEVGTFVGSSDFGSNGRANEKPQVLENSRLS